MTKHNFLCTALGFLLLAFLVFGNVLNADFVVLDDRLLVTENPLIREITPQTFKAIFTSYDPELYIPLTLLSYQIDFQIAGLHAGWYHAVNLVLHVMNAVLVMVIGYLLLVIGNKKIHKPMYQLLITNY